MALRQFVVGISLVILFAMGLLFFATQLVEQNNPGGLDSDNEVISNSLSSFNNSANELASTANSVKTKLEEDTPSPVFIFLIIYSAFTIPKAFLGFVLSGIGNITTLVFGSLFGSGSSNEFGVVIGVVSSILIITIIFFMVRAIRSGETER